MPNPLRINKTKLPLTVTVQDGELSITIGVETLAHAAAHNGLFWDGQAETAKPPYLDITDPTVFAQEVVNMMTEEAEDGSTLVTRMIDQACASTVDQGCEGVNHDG